MYMRNIVVILGITALFYASAEGCTCLDTTPVPALNEAVRSADVIVVARQIMIISATVVRLEILQNLKGATTSTVDIVGGTSCDFLYLSGFAGRQDTTTYILFLRKVNFGATPQTASVVHRIMGSSCEPHWSRAYWRPVFLPPLSMFLSGDSLARQIRLLVGVRASESIYDTRLFPNPTPDQTTLSWSLSKASAVTVEVFNALGERVVVVAAARWMPAGTHREPISLSELPAGVYFCRLRSGDGIRTERVLVAR
jgi:hypothetical protein